MAKLALELPSKYASCSIDVYFGEKNSRQDSEWQGDNMVTMVLIFDSNSEHVVQTWAKTGN